MEKQNKYSPINYLLLIIFAVCVFLVVSEMYTNTAEEYQTNVSRREFVVNSEELTDYTLYTPAPDAASYPTPASDSEADKYEDTGE